MLCPKNVYNSRSTRQGCYSNTLPYIRYDVFYKGGRPPYRIFDKPFFFIREAVCFSFTLVNDAWSTQGTAVLLLRAAVAAPGPAIFHAHASTAAVVGCFVCLVLVFALFISLLYHDSLSKEEYPEQCLAK